MCACAHFVCLPPFLPANFNLSRQAEAKVFTIMCATQENPNFPLSRTRQTDVWHCSSPFRPAQKLRRSFQHSARASHESHSSCSPAQFAYPGFFFPGEISPFFNKQIDKHLESLTFSNVNSTNFSILESNFAKFSIPKKWQKKKNNTVPILLQPFSHCTPNMHGVSQILFFCLITFLSFFWSFSP